MSMSKREVITVTASSDPGSLIEALQDVPSDASITGVELDEFADRRGDVFRSQAVLTFERSAEA